MNSSSIQRIAKSRRDYNAWVANETLEDYALRYTPHSFRRWSESRIAHTALGAVSFLALEAIGAAITVSYGFTNALWAILAVSLLIFLTGLPMVDHRNGDGLDNRRANLRPADASQNGANRVRLRGRSGYRGVTRHACGRWQAAICVRGKRRYLGLYDTPEGAAQAYDAAAVAAFGEYERPNFPSAVAS